MCFRFEAASSFGIYTRDYFSLCDKEAPMFCQVSRADVMLTSNAILDEFCTLVFCGSFDHYTGKMPCKYGPIFALY